MSWVSTFARYVYFIESMHDGIWHFVGEIYHSPEAVERDFRALLPNACRLQIVRQCLNTRERVIFTSYIPNDFAFEIDWKREGF